MTLQLSARSRNWRYVRCRKAGRAGFTLIEVLVVVAIIALLVSILLPALTKAKWTAKMVACEGNLHDLGLGVAMYAQTQNEYYPWVPSNPPAYVGCAVDSFCALYRARMLKNTKSLICPSTSNVIRPDSATKTPTTPLGGNANVWWFADASPAQPQDGTEAESDLYHTAPNGRDDSSGGHSYEYNSCYNPDYASNYPLSNAHKRSSNLMFPPQENMLVHDADNQRQDLIDAGNLAAAGFGCTNAGMSPQVMDGNDCPQPWDNHGESGMNIMYADGHVQFAKKTAGMISDYAQATTTFLPAPMFHVNAGLELIWAKASIPWRVRRMVP